MECIDLLRSDSSNRLLLLKSIKQLSMDNNTLSPLEQVGAITELINLFPLKGISPECINQVIQTLYNLTRIDRGRQDQAAKAGIIPHLMKIIEENSPLKQFALEIILDLGKTPSGRVELAKLNGVEFYLSLLTEYETWRFHTFDVLAQWMRDDQKIQQIMTKSKNLDIFVNAFITSTRVIFDKSIRSISTIVSYCPPIVALLSKNRAFVSSILNNVLNVTISTPVRVDLMKIVRSLCEATTDFPSFAKTHKLEKVLKQLSNDKILVAEIASNLYKEHFSKK